MHKIGHWLRDFYVILPLYFFAFFLSSFPYFFRIVHRRNATDKRAHSSERNRYLKQRSVCPWHIVTSNREVCPWRVVTSNREARVLGGSLSQTEKLVSLTDRYFKKRSSCPWRIVTSSNREARVLDASLPQTEKRLSLTHRYLKQKSMCPWRIVTIKQNRLQQPRVITVTELDVQHQ